MAVKICFFTTHYDFARANILYYYEKIIPKNVEIFLFCQKGYKEKFRTTRTKKFEYVSRNIFIPFSLANFCKKNKIQIVTNLSGQTKIALTMLFAKFCKKLKVVYYDHGNPQRSHLLQLMPLQIFFDRILIGAPDLKKKMEKYLFLIKRKILVLPTAIDTKLFYPQDRKRCRRLLRLDPNEKIITYVGRVEYYKGSDYLLKIIKKNPDKKFILMGTLIDKNYDLSRLPNVMSFVCTDRQKLINYLCASDLFIFLSRVEGLGLAYREAMACGIPTIVSDVEAVRTVGMTMKVPFNVKKIQKTIDSFFFLSWKEKVELERKTRALIVDEYSEKGLKSRHLKYFFNFN